MSINITSDDVKVIDINGHYIRIIPSRNLISENIIQALGIHWTTWDGLAGIQWIHIDGVCYNFHSFNQLIQMCKIKDVAIPATLRTHIYPVTIKKHDDFKEIDIMNNITTTTKTMSSLEIAELTGKRHDHVMRDIRNMIEQLEVAKKDSPNLGWHCESSTYINKQNKSQPCYLLDYNTTVNLLTGYDAAKRMMVIQRWQELEKPATPALPNFADPAEAAIAWANEYKEKQTLQLERDEAIKTRGQIRDKQLASAMGTAGALANKMKALEAKVGVIDTVKAKAVEFATILAIQSRVENLKASGLKLANYCRQKGLEIHAIPDERYGKIQSYPAQAWKDVYNININQVLGM